MSFAAGAAAGAFAVIIIVFALYMAGVFGKSDECPEVTEPQEPLDCPEPEECPSCPATGIVLSDIEGNAGKVGEFAEITINKYKTSKPVVEMIEKFNENLGGASMGKALENIQPTFNCVVDELSGYSLQGAMTEIQSGPAILRKCMKENLTEDNYNAIKAEVAEMCKVGGNDSTPPCRMYNDTNQLNPFRKAATFQDFETELNK